MKYRLMVEISMLHETILLEITLHHCKHQTMIEMGLQVNTRDKIILNVQFYSQQSMNNRSPTFLLTFLR